MTHILTLVAARDAAPLTPGMIAAARDAVRGSSVHILSAAEAVDITCDATAGIGAARAALGAAPVDLFLSPQAGRRKLLLVADMDSTIITSETLDELADFAGLKERISAITVRAMNGEIGFKDALRERVAMLRGLSIEALARTFERVQLTPGARALVGTMRAQGAYTALVSGGFSYFTSRVAALCGFHTQRANTLLDDGTALTGLVAEPILDRDTKLATLQGLAAQQALAAEATLAIGDGANDLDMIRAAGMGIAFHAKPIVAAEARYRIDHGTLRAALFAQGIPAAAFVTD